MRIVQKELTPSGIDRVEFLSSHTKTITYLISWHAVRPWLHLVSLPEERKDWTMLDMFPAYHILFKNGISSELAENWPTQWYTCVLAIPQQEHFQIS